MKYLEIFLLCICVWERGEGESKQGRERKRKRLDKKDIPAKHFAEILKGMCFKK